MLLGLIIFSLSILPLFAKKQEIIKERVMYKEVCILPPEKSNFEKLKLVSENTKLKDEIQTLKFKIAQKSKFSPYLKPLVNKYYKKFNLTPLEFEMFLNAILKNETGYQKHFIPKSVNHVYLPLGDGGNGCHAWQIDRRYHKMCKPLTFYQSGSYAIKEVLYPCYKRAKKRFKAKQDLLKATASCYNSGQFNDKYTTHRYGQRVISQIF